MKWSVSQTASGDRVLLTGTNERWKTVGIEQMLDVNSAEQLARDLLAATTAIRERRAKLPSGTIAARVKALRAQAQRCGELGDAAWEDGKKDRADRWHADRVRLSREADELEGKTR